MAAAGAEPLGAMGSDTPVAVLSTRPRMLFDYFTQMFAQVTNPPLDAIREELVTSIGGAIGPEPNLLEDGPGHARKLILPFPVIDNDQLAKIVHVAKEPVAGLPADDRPRPVQGRRRRSGARGAPRGDLRRGRRGGRRRRELRRAVGPRTPTPTWRRSRRCCCSSAVHHHTLRRHTRTQISLVVEAGDVREVHHVALLIGYGAAAVNPYLAMETVEDLARNGYLPGVEPEKAVANLIKALGKGVLKVMSKMGISTIASYRGAQVFEAIGLSQRARRQVLHRHDEPARRHRARRHRGRGRGAARRRLPGERQPAGAPAPRGRRRVPVAPGRRGAPVRPRDGVPAAALDAHAAVRRASASTPRGSTSSPTRLMTLRGLLRVQGGRAPAGPARRGRAGQRDRQAVQHRRDVLRLDLHGGARDARDRDEPASAASRTPARAARTPSACTTRVRRSAIKQIASGRFGVTSEYLTNADDIQIKLAQGAKPGEGGQLPGHKVYPWVARTRHSTPGVGLISPPPHHDIYSIEDLAQLIHDAKNANPTRADPHQARQRVRRRHGRGGRRQGALGRRAHLGSRRRHGREPADVAQARRHAVGDRPGRDAADARAQQPARPRGRPGRRAAQDRAATSSSARCSAPRSSASPRRRSSCRAAS